MFGLITLHFYQNKHVKKLKGIPVLLAVVIIILGQILSGMHRPDNQIANFSHFIKPDNALTLKLVKEVKSSGTYANFYANVQQINRHSTTGKLLVKIPKTKKVPHIGNTIRLLVTTTQIQKYPNRLILSGLIIAGL